VGLQCRLHVGLVERGEAAGTRRLTRGGQTRNVRLDGSHAMVAVLHRHDGVLSSNPLEPLNSPLATTRGLHMSSSQYKIRTALEAASHQPSSRRPTRTRRQHREPRTPLATRPPGCSRDPARLIRSE
jgi:hypothetical protein